LSILIVDVGKYAFILRSNRIGMRYVSHNFTFRQRVDDKLKDLQEGIQKFNWKEEVLELKKERIKLQTRYKNVVQGSFKKRYDFDLD